MQVEDSRTYLFARLFLGHDPTLDVRAFEHVSDEDLGSHLDRVAASWIRTTLGKMEGTAIVPWAKTISPPDDDLLAKLSPQDQEKIGFRYFYEEAAKGGIPPPPAFVLFHAEDTLSRAFLVAEALEATVKLGCPFQIALVPQSTRKPSDAIILERHISDWEKDMRVQEILNKGNAALSALKKLRSEALQFSSHAGKVAAPSVTAADEKPKGKRRAAPKLHEGHRLAMKSLVWLATEHPTVRTRGGQYELLRDCPAYAGLKRPKPDAWERYCRDLKKHGMQPADEKADVVE